MQLNVIDFGFDFRPRFKLIYEMGAIGLIGGIKIFLK